MKNAWKVSLISLVGVIAIVIFGIFGVQSFQNHAISLEEQVESASSDIKIQEKRRVDLVYNLADCVKQYDKHESETLKAIVSGRTSGSNDIENVTTAISAVSEAYPELKSSENYKQLMTENLIAEYRENYNKSVKSYRKYVKAFPQRSFLNMLGYDKKEFELLDFDAPESAPQNLFEE